jgi:Holliday junction resolvase RusA-like endonuclease
MADPLLTLRVIGSPAPQGSKRHVGGGRMIESSRHVRPWREAVKSAAVEAMGEQTLRLDGPLALVVTFLLKRPLRPKATRPDRVPDVSKLVRATEDALTDACVWTDDARVVDLVARKVYAKPGEPCGALITITRAA